MSKREEKHGTSNGAGSKMISIVAFHLDDRRFALYLPAVKRVIRIVEITPLPKAPEIVIGMINMEGNIIPVLNIRKRFRLPEREIRLSDHLIIADTSKRIVAIMVDTVSDVIEKAAHDIVGASAILPVMEYVEGVVKLEDGMVLVHDLDKFLSLDEERVLEDAMKEQQIEKDGTSDNETMKEEYMK